MSYHKLMMAVLERFDKEGFFNLNGWDLQFHTADGPARYGLFKVIFAFTANGDRWGDSIAIDIRDPGLTENTMPLLELFVTRIKNFGKKKTKPADASFGD